MSGRAQLFIGRLPLECRERDVEQVFERYGRLLRCDVKYGTGMAYAFVDYDDHRDAEDAIKYENGRDIRGQSIVVEWARGPSYRPSAGKQQSYFDECYRCRRTGHWARDCPDSDRERHYGGSSRRSRSRSPRRGGGGGSSRRPSRRSRYSRSASKSRSRSRSRTPRRDRRSWTRSPEPSRRRSRTRSPTPRSRRRDAAENGDRSPSRSRSRTGSPRPATSESAPGRRGSRSKSR